ncbi:MAG: hypothetical protein J2P34_09920 [Actinobacteria bacterium]|nr:hypothetical protein [Actinomycetota bacterium]
MARATPQTLTLVRHRAQPAAAFITRLSLTAVSAYLIALPLTDKLRPVLAPLTALLVVQITTYHTIRNAVQRVVSVVAGVLVAVALSALIGFTWWSLAMVVIAGLVLGHVLRLGEHVLEVPISGMLILAVGSGAAATGRISETLVGAGVGLLGGLIFPPLRVQPAEEAIEELSRQLAGLLEQMAADLQQGSITDKAAERLNRARALGRDIHRADQALAQAEESLRLNPRARLPLNPRARPLAHAGVALREGLETLEHVTTTIRGITRSLRDTADADAGPAQDPEIREALAAVLRELASAIRAYGRLVRADILGPAAASRELLHEELMQRLNSARALQQRLTDLLRPDPAAGLPAWPLRGELLTHLDRLRGELQAQQEARDRWPQQRTARRRAWLRARRPAIRRPPR